MKNAIIRAIAIHSLQTLFYFTNIHEDKSTNEPSTIAIPIKHDSYKYKSNNYLFNQI